MYIEPVKSVIIFAIFFLINVFVFDTYIHNTKLNALTFKFQ